MQRFVDRKEELQVLERAYSSSTGTLAIIYGQRRIGKTALINQFLKSKKGFWFEATLEAEEEQVRRFSSLLGKAIGNEILLEYGAKDWMSALRFLGSYQGSEKIVVAIDEFPYLIKIRKEVTSIFQAAWDQYLKDKNIMLILSGSSISMMQSNILNYSAPLYGRASTIIKLLPLKFKDVSKLIPKLSMKDKLQTYFILGGIPAYYSELYNFDSFQKVLWYILTNGSFFMSEPSLFLSEEVKKDTRFIQILSLIAEGVVEPNEIAGKTHILIQNLYYYLDTLLDLELIKKDFPVTEKFKERSKKVVYKINNPFILFWSLVLKQVKTQVENKEFDKAFEYSKLLLEPLFQKRFEEFTQEFISYKFPNFTKIGKWFGKNPKKPKGENEEEIDVVAINEISKEILFGECKWSNKKIDVDVYQKLKEKAELVDWNKNKRREYFAIFSKEGFTQKMKEIAMKEKVFLFDLNKIEEIFKRTTKRENKVE